LCDGCRRVRRDTYRRRLLHPPPLCVRCGEHRVPVGKGWRYCDRCRRATRRCIHCGDWTERKLDLVCAQCRGQRCRHCHGFGDRHHQDCVTRRDLPVCRICHLSVVEARGKQKCRACRSEECPACGHNHPPDGRHRPPRVRRDEITPQQLESVLWGNFGLAWRRAAQVVGKNDAFDVTMQSIEKIIRLAPYLRPVGLKKYFVLVCWYGAMRLAKRRWMYETPMDAEALQLAENQARGRERGRHVVPPARHPVEETV
jgi:hypothetical protein